uniref:Uncharacterized protein n=1 Tax=viral metagenome TaxID=1070528 RepID=A0A6H1ZQ90_9ZZZZ
MTDPKLVECERLLAAAEAKIARLLQRIADLEAAEPVSAVMQSQVDDVIGGVGDCETLPHMDPRRHPITQCLIATILHVARLRERETILNTTIANLHEEIDKLQKREREIYNRLDLVMAFIQPRTVVAQMYQDAPDG